MPKSSFYAKFFIKMDKLTDLESKSKDSILEEMASCGLQYGHSKSSIQPVVRPFISHIQNNVAIIDLEKTYEQLLEAIKVMESLGETDAPLLWVGTSAGARDFIAEAGEKTKQPYVISRWLGGLLTNFKVINQRLNYLLDLRQKLEKGELEQYTKKERMVREKELRELDDKFKGLENYQKLPKLLVVIDGKRHATALAEARKMSIPVIALLDTDDDISLATYPIVGNDSARSAIQFVINYLVEAYLKGQQKKNVSSPQQKEGGNN